jgi:hypothetical protein
MIYIFVLLLQSQEEEEEEEEFFFPSFFLLFHQIKNRSFHIFIHRHFFFEKKIFY